MLKRFVLSCLVPAILVLTPVECWARGGGGGGARGGGGGGGARGGGGAGMGGGGFNGGVQRGGYSGGMNAGARPNPSMGGAGNAFGGGSNMARPSGQNLGNRPTPNLGASGLNNARPNSASGFPAAGAGQRPGAPAGNPGSRVVPGQTGNANRYNAPSRNDLNDFMGLPSDDGFGHAAAAGKAGTLSTPSTLPAGQGKFDVNYGKKEGAQGGQAGGVTVTGPQGNTVGRAGAVGPQGGAAVVGGVQGANGGTAARGAAVGPNGQVVAGRGALGPGGYGGGGIVTAGPAGAGAGFTRITPSGRYSAAAAVRGNYNNWGIYGASWYTTYPGAWYAAGWTANTAWNYATWGTTASYCGYPEQPPVYYDYGNNVTYEDNSVYINGENAGTSEEYYESASKIAASGEDAPTDSEWLPLGVFAFTKPESPNSDITIQLAVNKSGDVRGNYTDTATKQNQVVNGAVDKQTQRVALTVGENKTNMIETGLYNLTKDEAPCLLHIGKDKTEQWMLVRLKNPEAN